MKFSFRYFTAFLIFIGLVALVGKQVLLTNEKSYTENFLDAINPFWNVNAVQNQENENFSHNFSVEITNNSSEEKIISGKIFLKNLDGTSLQNIGITDASEENPGNLVDFLLINPHQEAIPAGESKIFTTEWKGFGDKFLENKNVVVVFSSPIEDLRGDNAPRFYEKLVLETENFPLILQKEISISDAETQISEENISIPYEVLNKKLNTGLVVTIGFILIFLLIITKIFSRKNEENPTEKTLQEIQEFEK